MDNTKDSRSTVFLVRNNMIDSYTVSSFIYPVVYATRDSARKYVGVVAEYFADLSKEIEPYFTILEMPINE